MLVSELIEILMKQPQDAMVVVQSDPEGNDYHKARGADIANWCNDSTAEEYSSIDQAPVCVVIFP